MTQLTGRKVSSEVVGALKRRAAANARPAEAEHRDIQRASLFKAREDFATRAEALLRRLRSSVDSSEIIRANRDRDSTWVTGYVVDASVAVKWLVAEEFSGAAASLL